MAIKLTALTPGGEILFTEEIYAALFSSTLAGSLTVLQNHASLIVPLNPGLVRIKKKKTDVWSPWLVRRAMMNIYSRRSSAGIREVTEIQICTSVMEPVDPKKRPTYEKTLRRLKEELVRLSEKSGKLLDNSQKLTKSEQDKLIAKHTNLLMNLAQKINNEEIKIEICKKMDSGRE